MTSPSFNEKSAGIGFRVTTSDVGRLRKGTYADIEQTLLEAILSAADDGRLASLIFTWLKVHGAYVNVERLAKMAKPYLDREAPGISLLSGFAAFALEHCGQKWKKLTRRSREPIYLYPKEITDSAISIKGAVDYLKKFGFLVPNGSIRIREQDVLTPGELIKINRQYRNRYLYGPSWRAEIITAIESGAKSPSEIAKQTGSSYEPADRVYREYQLAKSAA